MNIEMGKVNEKINRIEELMTNFISQLADKGLQPPADNLEVWMYQSFQIIQTRVSGQTIITQDKSICCMYKLAHFSLRFFEIQPQLIMI